MQLPLPMTIPAARCLCTASTLRSLLALTTEEILTTIESGIIPHAFDLRDSNADQRGLCRIWRPTVEALIRSAGRESGPVASTEFVIEQLVPDRDVRSSELERWWTVSPQHVGSLIAAGLLPIRRSPTASHGPASFHLLDGRGLREFLASRVIGPRVVSEVMKCAAR